MRIVIEPSKCIASGACRLAAPDLFGQDEDGMVTLLDEAPPASLHEAARDAARSCPAAVITIED